MIVQDVVFNSVEDAQRFVSQAERWPSDVDVSLGSCMVDGKSLLGVLSLGIVQGTTITLIADGVDEKEAVDALADLIENQIGE